MTAIAYRNGELAVDSRLSEEDYILDNIEKVRVLTTKTGLWLIATSGEVGNYTKMADFLEDFILQDKENGRSAPLEEAEFLRRVSREYSVECEGLSGSVLVVCPSGVSVLFYAKSGYGGQYQKQITVTLGCVWQYLKGAMDAGASPKQAVHMACDQNGACSRPVRVYKAGFGEVE